MGTFLLMRASMTRSRRINQSFLTLGSDQIHQPARCTRPTSSVPFSVWRRWGRSRCTGTGARGAGAQSELAAAAGPSGRLCLSSCWSSRHTAREAALRSAALVVAGASRSRSCKIRMLLYVCCRDGSESTTVNRRNAGMSALTHGWGNINERSKQHLERLGRVHLTCVLFPCNFTFFTSGFSSLRP